MNERRIQLALMNSVVASVACAAPNYTPSGWWECDLWAVSKAGYVTEYEIKLSRSDFAADTHKSKYRSVMGYEKKHGAIRRDPNGPSRFYYVVPEEMRDVEVPEWAGLIVVSEDRHRLNLRTIKFAPLIAKRKVRPREIAQCQRRMWFRYWQSLKNIDRMICDRTATANLMAAHEKDGAF